MFHHNWIKTTGRVVDSRIRKVFHSHAVGIPLHDYIVEFRAPNGELTKLEVEQHLEIIDVHVGSDVPLLVSPDGTKAIFDNKDPSINVDAVAKARRDADKDRFRNQLGGNDDVNEHARRDAIAAFGDSKKRDD